ncbi:phage tail tape measure protein [Paenibacillus spongiae]|uniref:Phage tail tape measure protein n=1 Tax=Paenibacillus spongiae TaxID=2909671 RepID=A0ABY5S5P9_9BACL|nr:phage tail tape measure protein [Paenibacillus spongiae]UVI28165.1 phage tail tape measure protein [Paenibacillus spongiae]
MAGGVISNLMYAVGFKVDTRGLDAADSEITTLTKSVVGLGLAATTAAVGIGTAALSAANHFEKSMADVQSATGATAEQMEATKEVAQNLYAQNFGADWQDLGSAISTVQQVTSQTGTELEETTRSAILLRDQFGFEVPESIKSVDTMMRQFGITSEQAYDLLAQGAQKGLDKSGELMDSANEYANQFKSLGFTAEEMFDVFAAGSSEGVFQLDKVGDAVKEFNIRAKDGSKSSVEAFEMLGLNADAMMQTFASGGPAAKAAFSQILQMITDVEDPVLKNQIGVALMGTQFEDLEATVVASMGKATSQFESTGATLAELNKIKFDKPGEAFAMFRRQIEVGLLIPIGEKLLPYLTQFAQWISNHKPQIVALGQSIGDTIGSALTLIAEKAREVYDFIASNWDAITNTVLAIGAAVVGLRTAFAAMTIIGTVTKLYKAYRAGTLLATAAQIGLNVAMLANPMTWIAVGIAAVIAGIVLLIRNWDTVKAVMGRFWNWTKDVFGQIGAWFSQRFSEAAAGIKSAWSSIVSWFAGIWEGIKAVFMMVVSFYATIFRAAGSAIKTAFGVIVSWFSVIWENIKSVFAAVGTWFGEIFTLAVSAIKTAFGGIKDWFSGLWDNIKGGFTGFINVIISGINKLIDGLNKINIKMPEWAGGQEFGISIPNIPMLATGGIATGPTLAMIGEGAESEAVLPLSKLEALLNRPRYPEQSPAAPAAAAPARYSGTAGQSPVIINIQVDASGSGGGDSAAIKNAQIIAAEVKRQVQAIFESAGRILNVQGVE